MRLILTLHAVLLLLFVAPNTFAAEAAAQADIDYLLSFIENSNCRFIRDGTEYPPKKAVDHLRMKLNKAGGRVKTAEDFIAGIATKSYLSGKPYQIKLPNGTLRPTGPWLTEALQAHRK